MKYLPEQNFVILPNVQYYETDDGVSISNKKKRVVIQGKSTYRLISWLFMRLETAQSVQSWLPKEDLLKNKMLEILSILIEAGFVKTVSQTVDSGVLFFLSNFPGEPQKLLRIIRRQCFICAGDTGLLSAITLTLGALDVRNYYTQPINKVFQFRARQPIFLIAVDNLEQVFTTDVGLLAFAKQADGIMLVTKHYVYIIHPSITLVQLKRMTIDYSSTPSHRSSPAAIAMGAIFLVKLALTTKFAEKKNAVSLRINQLTLDCEYCG